MIRRSMVSMAVAVLAGMGGGCLESPQSVISYDAVAIAETDPVVQVGAWSVRVIRAEIAFGPVYFCASASGSSTLCASAISEILSVARIDGLQSAPQPIGRLRGYTGRIQSASYDFGISWSDTSTQATPSPAAPGGHSMHLEGEATRGAEVVPFVADVDLVPQYQGQTAVPTAPAEAQIDSSAYRLEVTFRVADWLRQLDYDALAASGQRPFAIKPGSPEHNGILLGIKNLAPPIFRWTRTL